MATLCHFVFTTHAANTFSILSHSVSSIPAPGSEQRRVERRNNAARDARLAERHLADARARLHEALARALFRLHETLGAAALLVVAVCVVVELLAL